MNSEICVLGSVSATRFGIMNGTFEDGLPRPKMRRPVGSLSLIVKVFGSSPTVIDSTKVISFWPSASLAPQRLIEAMQSSAVTGLPSCQSEPVAQREGVGQLVRRLVVFLDHLRLDLALLVHREERVVDHVAVVAGDVGRGPDRIDDLEVRMHDDAQRRLRRGRERPHGGARGERDGCRRDLPTPVHAGLPLQIAGAPRARLRRAASIGAPVFGRMRHAAASAVKRLSAQGLNAAAGRRGGTTFRCGGLSARSRSARRRRPPRRRSRPPCGPAPEARRRAAHRRPRGTS